MALARSLPNTPKIRSLPLSSPSQQTNNRSFVEVFRAAPPARFRFGPRTTPRGLRDARRPATHCDPRVPTRVRLDRTSREVRSGARAADRARRAPSASSSAVRGWIARRRGRLARRRAGGGENLGRGSRRPPARSRDGAMAANEPLGKLEWNFSQVFGERTPGEEVQDGAFESRGAARSARWRVLSFSLAIADARAPPPPPPPPPASPSRARAAIAPPAPRGARSAPPTPRNPGDRASRPALPPPPGRTCARSIPPGRPRAHAAAPATAQRARVARSNETRPRVILGVGFWGKTVRALVVARVPEASSRRGRPPSFASLKKNAPRPSPPPPKPPLPPAARLSSSPSSPPPPSSSHLTQPTSSPRWSLTNPGSTSRRAIAAVASSYSSVFIRARTRPRRRVGARAATPRTRLGSEYRRWSTAT